MPRCRCTEKCNVEIESGSPFVEVKRFESPSQSTMVALEHAVSSKIMIELANMKEEINFLRKEFHDLREALGE